MQVMTILISILVVFKDWVDYSASFLIFKFNMFSVRSSNFSSRVSDINKQVLGVIYIVLIIKRST